MIPIIKKNNILLFEVSNNFSFQNTPSTSEVYKNNYPKLLLSNKNKIICFDIWKQMFEDEVQDIINEYIEFITEISIINNYHVIINIQEFTNALRKIIYDSSMNKYKYYQCFI
jgi:predicted RNA methylase